MSESESKTQKKFVDYQLAEDVLEGLRRMGLETPTPIQELCLPPILEGKDVVAKAETGTGKTIGFGAPLVGKIDTQRVATQAIVLTPTRELAKQVAEVIEEIGKGRRLGVAMVVGGVHAAEQLMKLRSGSQVVVGTPGRVLDFLRERHLSLAWSETVVLDEADRMLDMGFIDDVTEILNRTPDERQTLLLSATIPPEVQKLLSRYMKDPVIVSTSKGRTAAREIQQQYVEATQHRKFRELCRILDRYPEGPVIVFCNTRRRTIDIDRMLWGHGYSAGALHGDQEQDVRFKVLESFRQGSVKCLVCTDVASRGLDIDEVSCVVNYEIPDDEDSYVHRIGRTGRAQKKGVAISIVSPQERGTWQRILRTMDGKIERLGQPRSDDKDKDKDKDEDTSRRGRGRSRRREGGRARAPEEGGGAEAGAPAGERSGRRRRGGRRSRRDESRLRPEEARENGSSARPGRDETAAVESPDAEKPSLTYASPRLAEKSAAKRQLKKLDEIDDDFVKTDYFDIDHSLIRKPSGSTPPSSSRGERDSEDSRSRRDGAGRGSRGRGRGSRGRGRGSRRGGGGGRPGEGEAAAGEGAPQSPRGDSEDRPGDASTGEGEKRSRPRRRRRRRSGSGSGSGSGSSAPREQ